MKLIGDGSYFGLGHGSALGLTESELPNVSIVASYGQVYEIGMGES